MSALHAPMQLVVKQYKHQAAIDVLLVYRKHREKLFNIGNGYKLVADCSNVKGLIVLAVNGKQILDTGLARAGH